MNSNRLIPLEACRGIASIIVLLSHFLLAFYPEEIGLLPQNRNDSSLIGHWYFLFFNGAGAVSLFFVLSGFVLIKKYFESKDLIALRVSFFKRLPRLSGPVAITTIASYFLFEHNFYYFYSAAEISNSAWLASYGFSGWSQNFAPSLFEALTQGVTTFLTGNASYNPNLWTMKPEFMGSLVVFMLGAFICLVFSFQSLLIGFTFFSLWALGSYPYLLPFFCGTFLCAFLEVNNIKLKLPVALLFLSVGLYFLGFSIPEKDYIWLSRDDLPNLVKNNLQIMLHSLGASLVIFSTLRSRQIYYFLNGKIWFYLGRLSFPLYLVHTIVICSFSSFLYLNIIEINFYFDFNFHILLLSTLFFSLLLSIPLMFFDEFWIKFINSIIRQSSSESKI